MEQRPQDAQSADPEASAHAEGTLYRSLESYPWHTDPEFQSGLHAILGPSAASASAPPNQAQNQDLTLRARCFYYTRKYDIPVDFLAYKTWREQQPAATLSPLAPATLMPPQDDSAPSSAETTPSKAGARGVANGLGAGSGALGGSDAQTQVVVGQQQEQEDGQPAYPPSFATIMELIKSGQPIPGIKDIPDTVLVGQATEATRDRRKKPWEERQTRDVVDAEGGDSRYAGYFGGPRPQSGQDSLRSGLFAPADEQ